MLLHVQIRTLVMLRDVLPVNGFEWSITKNLASYSCFSKSKWWTDSKETDSLKASIRYAGFLGIKNFTLYALFPWNRHCFGWFFENLRNGSTLPILVKNDIHLTGFWWRKRLTLIYFQKQIRWEITLLINVRKAKNSLAYSLLVPFQLSMEVL